MSNRDQAARRIQPREKQKPKYVARAKVGQGWQTIGAAWPFRSGEDGLSLQINTIPLNWDGRFTLIPPLTNDEVPEPPADE
jgi:hypothetical protein